jgi:glucose 1-dehydrogenase
MPSLVNAERPVRPHERSALLSSSQNNGCGAAPESAAAMRPCSPDVVMQRCPARWGLRYPRPATGPPHTPGHVVRGTVQRPGSRGDNTAEAGTAARREAGRRPGCEPPLRGGTREGTAGQGRLVTGGSSGIGQAIAVRLGEEGVNVAVNYVGRPEGAEETREQIDHGVQICMKELAASRTHPILVEADVSQEEQVVAMFDRVRGEYGRIDILINNAGIQIAAESHELPAEHFDKVLAVNLRGAFLCAREAVRGFLDQARMPSAFAESGGAATTAGTSTGSIVNVSSVHQLIPKPRFLGYSVSKGGMQNLTRSLALEYAARGIRVNGGDGRGCRLALLGRGRLHHRPDPLRRRRAHPLPVFRDDLVVRMSTRAKPAERAEPTEFEQQTAG